MSDQDQPQNQTKTINSQPAIIQVAPQEELGGLLQRIRQESATEIRLVIPDKATIAQGSIALKILADVAAKLKKDILVASDSTQIQSLSRRAGLRVDGIEAGDVDGHGFIPGTDVALANPELISSEAKEQPSASTHDAVSQDDDSHQGAGSGLLGGGFTGILAWLKTHKVGLGVAAAFIIVAFGGMLMATYYLPKATVTLYTEKRTIDRDLQVTADPKVTSVDRESLTVPANVISAQSSVTKTYPATGTEEVGEKATGVITIVNTSLDQKSLPAGTIVTSSGKQFSLKSAVTVPAAEKEFLITTNGKADVKVVAAAIGPDYNIPADSRFAIGAFDTSTLAGANSADFSGGTREEVTVITAEDQDKALTEIAQEAHQKAVDELRKKLNPGQLLLDDAVSVETNSNQYSHQVGAEVSEFSLTIAASAEAPVVNEEDLQSLLADAVEAKVPDGYRLEGSDHEIENHVLQVDNNGVLFLTSTFKAQVVPVVDTDQLIEDIKGEHPSAVESFLKSQPNLNGYDISLSPKLPGPFYRLPRVESNISVTVQVQE